MRYIELFEGREAPLYHGTAWTSASRILEENEVQAKTYHKASQLYQMPVISERLIEGVSLTRDFKVAKTFGEIIFVIDQSKLATRHKIVPIDFWSKASSYEKDLSGNEREEFVIGPIKNFDRYLSEIRIAKKWYDNNIANGRADRLYTNGVPGLALLKTHPKLRLF